VTETLPYSWYTDEELLSHERSLIFARSWRYAGRAAQVAQPGSYLRHRLVDHGRLLLNAEPLLAAFQGWVAERLAA
jgi:phenylpropionate dioxygenase-like ring-hydroxylating dioxygenase large terminal subunit